MKLEKLGRNKRKKIAIGVVIFLCFISAIMFVGSRAKYKVTESIPLVNGTINYKPYDFKMMAMYQVNDSGGYTEIEAMPTSGYEINEEKSYCTTDNVNKDTTAKLFTNGQGQHVFENLKKNDKCYIWFDVKKLTVQDLIANHNPTAGSTSFTGVATSNEGLKSGTDDDGTTYYFRGNVTNNWVQFAGFYWRIIRINGDGSIRMIYNGPTTDQTGETTQIGKSAYNTNHNDNAYVGYMYGNAGASTYSATHANTNNSTIKGIVDSWYKTNIVDKGYSSKLSPDAGFCNDRSVALENENWWKYDTKKGYGNNNTAYSAWNRISEVNDTYKSIQNPTFKCKNSSNDLFTANDSIKGNKKLTYPVGLITVDEAVFAGGFGGATNNSYYLNTNQAYWTITPVNYYGSTFVYFLSSGYILDGNYSDYAVFFATGVRPVINLSPDVKLTGTGTTSDPYKVV